MKEASSRVMGQSFIEWPAFPQTSHVMCESMAWMVPIMASLSYYRSSSIFINKSIFAESMFVFFMVHIPFCVFLSSPSFDLSPFYR
jgi:hypothetical protein